MVAAADRLAGLLSKRRHLMQGGLMEFGLLCGILEGLLDPIYPVS